MFSFANIRSSFWKIVESIRQNKRIQINCLDVVSTNIVYNKLKICFKREALKAFWKTVGGPKFRCNRYKLKIYASDFLNSKIINPNSTFGNSSKNVTGSLEKVPKRM